MPKINRNATLNHHPILLLVQTRAELDKRWEKLLNAKPPIDLLNAARAIQTDDPTSMLSPTAYVLITPKLKKKIKSNLDQIT